MESCSLNNPKQLLTCKKTIRDKSVEFDIRNQTITLPGSSQSLWKLQGNSTLEYSKFCNPNSVFCGPPEPGVNSFIVTLETNRILKNS